MSAQASLDAFVSERLDHLEANALRRRLRPSVREDGHVVTRDGCDFISFSCNDYLGLSRHPRVIEAAREALDKYGLGSGASRLITGNHPLFKALETRLALLKDTQDAIIFGSGYMANLGTIPALMRPGDLLLVDEWAHNCVHAGAAMAQATVLRFKHNDMSHLQELLAAHRADNAKCLIATDGVFSMDGDLAPLPDLLKLCDDYDAWALVDDAHGLGVVGGGRGSAFAFNPPAKAHLQMGTLSKALGSYGGYVCASHAVCEFLRNRARTFVYTTGLPPVSVAGALAALDVIADEPELTEIPRRRAKQFCRALNLPEPESSIVPVILGDAQSALDASKLLEEHGLLVMPIRPPTVPEGTARLRIAFGAKHTEDQVLRLAELLRPLALNEGDAE
jgi:8-amino-7-oxononanoate synthase